MFSDLQSVDLAPIVARVLNKTNLEVLEWQITPLNGWGKAVGGGEGVARISGTARDSDGTHPWSLFLKGLGATDQYDGLNPASWNYWKREALAYQSGLLDDLPGGLSAPRCYAVQEQGDEEVRLWLEEIQGVTDAWATAHYSLAARHLGQFNGAYLAGYPLSRAQPWLSRGRAVPWAPFLEGFLAQSEQLAKTPVGQRIFRGDAVARMCGQWADSKRMLGAFARLPVCFCHHDAFRRNLLIRSMGAGADETVAIDWALTGLGRVGEEIGVTMAIATTFADIRFSQLRELDEVVFGGYLDGLREAGWHGDARLARLGYTVNASLLYDFFCSLRAVRPATPETIAALEAQAKLPYDDYLEQMAQALPFFLDLGDEACALAATLSIPLAEREA